jgi:hypothetical protein
MAVTNSPRCPGAGRGGSCCRPRCMWRLTSDRPAVYLVWTQSAPPAPTASISKHERWDEALRPIQAPQAKDRERSVRAHAENSALSNMHFYALICLLTHVLRLGRDSSKCVVRPCRCPQGRSQFADSACWAEGSITAVSRPGFPGSACALSGDDVHRRAGSADDAGGLRQSAVLPNPPAQEIKVAPLRAEDRAEAAPGAAAATGGGGHAGPEVKSGARG